MYNALYIRENLKVLHQVYKAKEKKEKKRNNNNNNNNNNTKCTLLDHFEFVDIMK